MKRIVALLLGGLLLLNLAVIGAPSEADQKWLGAVQNMVTKGDKTVSTPSADRANLLKEWCANNGYSAKVTKTDTGYTVEVSKQLAQR